MTDKQTGLAGDAIAMVGMQGEPKGRSAPSRRMTSTRELLAGGNEVKIEHNGEIYTLRQTSKGKLILTK